MNVELFIAKRIYQSTSKGKKRVSAPAIKIAIAGVTIGMIAMILAVSIVIGFKSEVRNKVIGFGSHLQISNFDNSTSYETHPICAEEILLEKIHSIDNVDRTQVYATKPAIIKTDDAFQGIILKGVGEDFDWSFFEKNLLEGEVIHTNDSTASNHVIISQSIANKLNLKLGDTFINYFVEEPIRMRKFKITGIYSTNFEEYDKMFVLTDIRLIQKLNKWRSDQVSGIEVLVKDYDQLDTTKDILFVEMMKTQDKDGSSLCTRSIKDINPMIFSWLELLDMNVVVIIILMLTISAFTMISGLLIIILERTNMIGMLKSFGLRNDGIRKTFLYVASFLVLRGMFWGNLIAIAIIAIQKLFGLIKLDPATYYVTEVPVDFNIIHILLINIGTLAISMLMLIGPSYLIAKISPTKSIRFE